MGVYICVLVHAQYFLKHFIYLFLERREGREKEGEKHQCEVCFHGPQTGDLAATQPCALTGN